MRKKHFLFASVLALLCGSSTLHAQDFKLTSSGYFKNQGVDVMAFDDIYPEGHQGGVCIIMNGHRVATNGDIRLEATPGQWQPVPKQLDRKLGDNSITATLCYPDSSRHLTGFNPMIYPDLHLIYTVNVESKGKNIEVTVDLDRPIPQEFIGKVGFTVVGNGINDPLFRGCRYGLRCGFLAGRGVHRYRGRDCFNCAFLLLFGIGIELVLAAAQHGFHIRHGHSGIVLVLCRTVLSDKLIGVEIR